MKRKNVFIAFSLLIMMILSACSGISTQGNISESSLQPSGKIYLYGEYHGVENILNKEFELWYDYYHEENMRHLFIEFPYYTAEFLNLWMQSDDDAILDEIYRDWAGTASYSPVVKEFYQKIKKQCPETIFHGTDVGHQSDTTGQRFLKYLQNNNLETSEEYLLANKAIEQGKLFYKNSDDAYRENMMTENFIYAFNKISNENIMGIYGAAHTGFEAMAYNAPTVPCMANQLKKHYGDIIYSEDLSYLAKETEPLKVDTISVHGKDYKASYFGKESLAFKDFTSREFWRLENAYDDFSDEPTTGDVLPYNNYPIVIETGQVFVIDYTKTDGSITRLYYRSDGGIWQGKPTTVNFAVE